MTNRNQILSAILLIGLMSNSIVPNAQTQGSSKTKIAINKLNSKIPLLMAEANVPGLSIAVVEKGEIVWSRAFGIASAKHNRATSTDTIFEAASLGKVVFALITLKLADKGIIDLDESIAANFQYPIPNTGPRQTFLDIDASANLTAPFRIT